MRFLKKKKKETEKEKNKFPYTKDETWDTFQNYIKSKYTPETSEEKIERLTKNVVNLSEEQLMEKFHEETGKNAIWRGNVTKQYLEWKERL